MATIDQLVQRQDALQAQAAAVSDELGIDDLLSEVGEPIRVGSAALGLMVWRDLDITVVCGALDVVAVAAIGARLAAHARIRQVLFKNDTGHWNTDPGYPDGLYLGPQYRSLQAQDWNIDIWFVDQPERQPDLVHLRDWPTRLTPEIREAILQIKDTWATRPEYRTQVLSYDIYTSVLDDGVRTLEQFDAWLQGPRHKRR